MDGPLHFCVRDENVRDDSPQQRCLRNESTIEKHKKESNYYRIPAGPPAAHLLNRFGDYEIQNVLLHRHLYAPTNRLHNQSNQNIC